MAADLSEEMVRRAHDLSDQVQDTASSAKNYASDQYERISSAVAGGSSQVKGAADVAGATIGSSSEKIKDSAVSAGPAMADRANSLKDDGLRIAGFGSFDCSRHCIWRHGGHSERRKFGRRYRSGCGEDH